MSSIQILTRLMVSLSFVVLSLVWGSDAFAGHGGGSYSRLMSRDQSIRALDRQRIELNQERSFNQARERDIIRNRDRAARQARRSRPTPTDRVSKRLVLDVRPLGNVDTTLTNGADRARLTASPPTDRRGLRRRPQLTPIGSIQPYGFISRDTR